MPGDTPIWRMDELQARVMVIAEGAADGGSLAAFNVIQRLAYGMANRLQPVRGPRGVRLRPTPPRLT